MTNIPELPYRKNVSCIVFKNRKFLLIQHVGWAKKLWKFPQGGVKSRETEKNAVIRELKEELGSDKFKIVGKSKFTNKYKWSCQSVKRAGGKWIGQKQRFFIVEFLGKNNHIKINKREINKFKWVTKDELKLYIDHDLTSFLNYRKTIEKVLCEFCLYSI